MSEPALALVPVKLSTGQIVQVPAKEAAALESGAAHAISPEEAAADKERAFYTDALAKAGAAGLGAVDTATMGLGTQSYLAAAEALGGAPTVSKAREVIKGMEEYNPELYESGQLGGFILGAEATGGGSAAEGGVARLLPSALTREGAGLGARMLAKAIPAAARGAVETAQLDVSKQLTEDSLGDRDTNAEKLLSSVLSPDLLIGAGLGGGLGAIGEAAPSAFRSLVPRTRALAAADDAVAGVPGAGSAVRRNAADVSASLDALQNVGVASDEGRTVISQITKMADAAAENPAARKTLDSFVDGLVKLHPEKEGVLREIYTRGLANAEEQRAALNIATRDLTAAGNTAMRDALDTVNEAAFLEKPEQFRKLVDESKLVEAKDAAIRILQDAHGTLSELESVEGKGGSPLAVKRLRGNLTEYARTVMSEDASVASLHNAVDNLKRDVGKSSNFGHGPMGLTEAARALGGSGKDMGESLYGRIRASLEDGGVWGEDAAAAQREINSATHQRLSTAQNFESDFTVRRGDVGGRGIREFDSSKAASFLGRAGSAANDTTEANLRDFIAGVRAQSNAVEKHLALTPQQAANIARGRAAVDKLETTLNATKAEAERVNRIKLAKAEEDGRGLPGMLGFVTSPLSRPIQTVERLADLQRTVERATKSLHTAVKSFVEGKGAKAAGEATLTKASRERTPALIAKIHEMASNPIAMTAKARSLAGDLGAFAPGHGGAVATQLARIVSYLAMKAPRGFSQAGPLVHREPPRYSDAELAKFEKTVEAATNPVKALESGRLTRDQVDCIKFTAPGIYSELRERTLDQLAKMDEDGTLAKMPYDHKIQIAALLGIPADATLTPGFVAAMQAVKAQDAASGNEPQPEQQSRARFSGRPINPQKAAASFQTEGDRLADGGTP